VFFANERTFLSWLNFTGKWLGERGQGASWVGLTRILKCSAGVWCSRPWRPRCRTAQLWRQGRKDLGWLVHPRR
jgi:hypothetical protein